ncbi:MULTISPECIES: hypothetical protein [unclassified Rhizobium]|uniref:hypothetical protein n=1 Tax=unclassified Rhizobium TaxID=2613769 RepID=UPI000AFC287D|nr:MULTISPECIES: hypothetical protein [unclassified Rhizobium]
MKTLPARMPGRFEEPNTGSVEAYVSVLFMIANRLHRLLPARLNGLRFMHDRIVAALLDICATA